MKWAPWASYSNLRPRNRRQKVVLVSVEQLERRLVLSTDGLNPLLFAHPMTSSTGAPAPFATTGPTGYTPAQVRHAYGFDEITFGGGAIAGDGRGMTIAIVDAYDSPRIANDLHQFNLQFGLPDSGFTKVNQNGGTVYPRADRGWIGEIALDVQWAHAIAPLANILLVEANDNSFTNLLAAVDYARQQPGVVAVSMSWGSGEFPSETGFDHFFTTPVGHQGVTFVVSSGDNGAPVSYPASSPNVISIGGTTLNLDSQGIYLSESAWVGSGGGISAYEQKPDYQTSIVMPTTTIRRTNPDVSYNSNPNTGFPVYDSYNNGPIRPWSQFGGTSAAAPQWAGLIAIADQGRALNGLPSLDGATETLPLIYSMDAGNFHDIKTGTSTGKPPYSAIAGFDFATGLGSPRANSVVQDLAGEPTDPENPDVVSLALSMPETVVAGQLFNMTVSALNNKGETVPDYLGRIHFSTSDLASGFPADYLFTSQDHGSHTFTAVSLKTAGTQLVTVTDTATQFVFDNSTVLVNPAVADHLVFGQQPSDVLQSAIISPAVTVRILDAYGNVVTNADQQVSLRLGTNPNGGILSGTNPVGVQNGVATFTDLSINQSGPDYTLLASTPGLALVASSSFKIFGSRLIDGFESGNLSGYSTLGARSPTAVVINASAHDGNWGLRDSAGNDWIYRNDSAAQVKPGDTISVWMRFEGDKTGTASFGFAATPVGSLSLTASGPSKQVLLQLNSSYSSVTIGAAPLAWVPNHWYRLEVVRGSKGKINGRVYDSNSTTLLNTVTTNLLYFKSGGISFRSSTGQTNWDTVQITPGSTSTGGGGGVKGGTAPNDQLATAKSKPVENASRTQTSPVTIGIEKPLTAAAVMLAIDVKLGKAVAVTATPTYPPAVAKKSVTSEKISSVLSCGVLKQLSLQDQLFRNPLLSEVAFFEDVRPNLKSNLLRS